MAANSSKPSEEVLRAFAEYDRKATFNNFRAACYLGIMLMPLGTLLDYFVYRDSVTRFLELRLLCSALIVVFWGLVSTSLGQKHHKKLGVILAMFPTLCISVMIADKDGALSPYYAGLTLVLLMIGFVLNWGFAESLTAVGLVVAIYTAACWVHGWPEDRSEDLRRMFFNNLYFIGVTGVIVVTGSLFHSRLRFSEFALRFELDRNQQQLKETNEKLVELDQVKNRFFANISHELRTPLTLLLAPLETLIQRYNRSFDQETHELFGTMHSNGMRLLKLINDLLDLVRLESGRMQVKPEPVEVEQFVRGLASAARQVAQDKQIRLETWVDSALGTVLADRDKLEKVILNLVFNALKFTPAGGRVELRAERRGEELELVVSDTGMGIAEKNLPFIFDRFWQVDTSSQRKYQGVGIGLALVKELVELHGGRVTVQSQEGQGTTFTIRIPYLVPVVSNSDQKEPTVRETAETNTASTTESEEWLANLYRRAELFPALTPVRDSVRPVETWHEGDRPRVLVADDEPDMLRFLKFQLRDQYEVIEAVDGDQAVEKARQFLPDLILLDMMMPEKDGLQACRELRDQTPTQSLPVILLTARADEATKLSALNAGANDFLTKPFSSTELHIRIRNLIESYHYQRKLAKQNQVLECTIEQLKETESELVESEKMRSLGQLSAGMIHEINNPLNFAATGLFTLRGKAKWLPADQQNEYLDILNDAAEGVNRVKELVCRMREYSYADNSVTEEVNVSQVVNSALRLLNHEWKGKVEVVKEVPEEQHFWANKNRLIQVVLNLVQNSLDALSDKTFSEEKPTIRIESRTEGERTLLIVRDNGPGIKSEHMDKIFDPFFTTKEVGRGMGLGLSICYRIVQDYGGRIFVRSELGQFCEFRLELPLQRPQEDPAALAS